MERMEILEQREGKERMVGLLNWVLAWLDWSNENGGAVYKIIANDIIKATADEVKQYIRDMKHLIEKGDIDDMMVFISKNEVIIDTGKGCIKIKKVKKER
jgi:hypothetical protein